MPITPTNRFKGRQYPGEVILLAVRWYLRYPLAYLHVSEILAERGLLVATSCIWRWVQAYAPELDKRCRPHLKATNKSYRVDETYIKNSERESEQAPHSRGFLKDEELGPSIYLHYLEERCRMDYASACAADCPHG